jgi:hypothetical protein
MCKDLEVEEIQVSIFDLSFAQHEKRCLVQATAIDPPYSIWAAQYPSKEVAEDDLKGAGVIPIDSAVPPPSFSMRTLDISDQALIKAGFKHALRV